MKLSRKMITVFIPVWDRYLKALKKKAVKQNVPNLSVSQDLSQYMESEAEKYK